LSDRGRTPVREGRRHIDLGVIDRS